MKIAHELNNQKCIICGSSFETKGKLKSHISNVYENKCHKCEATFDNTKSLKNHMKIAHELINQKCTICGPSFETKGKLKSHKSNVYENKCHKCEGTSGYIKSLKNHMKIAQEVNNQNCMLCGSSFETKGELKSHTSRIHEKITKKPLKIASLPKPN
jgi:transcription elongation factor Elf1